MGIETYLKDIRKYPPFTKEDERVILLKAKAGDRDAYEELMNRNLRFVVSVAKKYQNQGLPLEELISEGNAGLVIAFNKFDEKKYDVKFITYGVWWIKQAIMKAVRDNAKVIRLPLNIIMEMTKLNRVKRVLEQEVGRTLTSQEILELTDDEEITKAIKYNYGIVDLYEPRTEDEKDLSHILVDDKNVDIQISLEDIKDELKFILEDFSERERDILIMYFGIDQMRPYTLKEIGVDKGLTRERIRQIKKKSLKKLRRNPKSRSLLDKYL